MARTLTVGFNAIKKLIEEIEECDHANTRPLCNLWRAQRKFSNASFDRDQTPIEGCARDFRQ
jgi:hypothetical protein